MKIDGRSVLKPGQLDILELLYKYRFGSRQLLADSLGIKAGSSLHEKLEVLVKHGYVEKRLDKRLKLLGMPAAYYLTPKGIRTLQTLPEHDFITDSKVKASYKDKTVSQTFITHTLGVYKYTNLLKHRYPGLKVFTRRDMSRYSYFPKQLPDAFLSLPIDNEVSPKRFFLDLIPDTAPHQAVDSRIAQYSKFFEDGGWDVTNSKLPDILFIGEKGSTEKRVRRVVKASIGRSDFDELLVLTSTTGALERMDSESRIWTSLEDPDELLELSSLS